MSLRRAAAIEALWVLIAATAAMAMATALFGWQWMDLQCLTFFSPYSLWDVAPRQSVWLFLFTILLVRYAFLLARSSLRTGGAPAIRVMAGAIVTGAALLGTAVDGLALLGRLLWGPDPAASPDQPWFVAHFALLALLWSALCLTPFAVAVIAGIGVVRSAKRTHGRDDRPTAAQEIDTAGKRPGETRSDP